MMQHNLSRIAFALAAVTCMTPALAYDVPVTAINGVTIDGNDPEDEVYVPQSEYSSFDVDWSSEAQLDDLIVRVDNQQITCVGDCGDSSATSGTITVDQSSLGDGRHVIQLEGVDGMRSVNGPTYAFWSTPYWEATGDPACDNTTKGTYVGQPVNVATGEMHHKATDLVIQGPLPIVFSRRYESRSDYDGPFGYGWTHSYDMRLESPGGSRPIFVDKDGRRIYFNKTQIRGGGTHTTEWDSNRIDQLSLDSDSPNWVVRDKREMEYTFDSSGVLISIADRHGSTLTFNYTSSKLTSIVDPFGRTLTLTYDGNDRIETASAGGRTFTYGYDGDGNLQTVHFPNCTTGSETCSSETCTIVAYEYDDTNDDHDMTAAKDSYCQVIEEHEYTNDQVTHTESEGGNYAYDLVYDSATQTTVTNSRDVDTVYEHNDYAQDYGTADFSGLVTQRTGPGCGTCGTADDDVTLTYSRTLNLVEITRTIESSSITTEMIYDYPTSNLVERIENSGSLPKRHLAFTYDSTWENFPKTIRPKTTVGSNCDPSGVGMIVTNTYDTNTGDVTAQTVQGCGGADQSDYFTYVTSFDYDDYGQITEVDGPRTDVTDTTTFAYYPDTADLEDRGRLYTVTNAAGHVTTYSDYDVFGNVGTITDPNGVETTYEYDYGDRVTEVRIDGGAESDAVTEYHYDLNGNLDFVRMPNCVEANVVAMETVCDFTVDYTYDEVNRLEAIEDAVGNSIVYTYDTEGNRTRVEYQDSGTTVRRFTNFMYDDYNRLEYEYFTTTAPEAMGSVFSKFSYYSDGLPDAHWDPEGHISVLDFDKLRRLERATQVDDTSPSSNLNTLFTYDNMSNLETVEDPRSVSGSIKTTYVNNDLGWVYKVLSPDGGVTENDFDKAGNLIWTKDAEDVESDRTYDALNRLTGVEYSDSSLNVTYTYDSTAGGNFGKGRRTGMSDASGVTAYFYDRRGLLISEEKTIGSRTFVTQYEYDLTGNLEHVLYPTDEPLRRQGETQFGIDSANRVTSIGAIVGGSSETIASSIQYHPFGPRTNVTFGSSVAETRTYDTRYQPVDWDLGSLLDYTYEFYLDGNLKGWDDNDDSGNDRDFVYDEFHRLTGAVGPWGDADTCSGGATYTYDKGGNRLCKGEDADATTYTYSSSSNKLVTSTLDSVETSYSYDENGNIEDDEQHSYEFGENNRLLTVDSGATAEYVYDGDGRRVKKTTSSATTYYFYDPTGRVLSEMDSSWEHGTDYVYLQGTPIARVDWSVMEDVLGNTLVMDLSQTEEVRADWSAFQGRSYDYLIRRKEIVDPSDKSFDGSQVIAVVNDPTQYYDDHVFASDDEYDYEVVRRTMSEDPYYYHTDYLGTPLAMTDDGGSLVWRAEYRPFGDLFSLNDGIQDPVESNLRFPGQYLDMETGLFQNYRRDYDATVGRYREPDVVGLAGGDTNLFRYARGVPTGRTDRQGLFSDSPYMRLREIQQLEDTCENCRDIVDRYIRAAPAAAFAIVLGFEGSAAVGSGLLAEFPALQRYADRVASACSQVLPGARSIPTLSRVLPNVSTKDARILQRAADLARQGAGSFTEDLAALSQATSEVIPGGQVHAIGVYQGARVFGSQASRIGIVVSESGVLVVRAGINGAIQILGKFR